MSDGAVCIRIFQRSPRPAAGPPKEDQIGICHANIDALHYEEEDAEHAYDQEMDDLYIDPLMRPEPDLLPLRQARASTSRLSPLPPPFAPASSSSGLPPHPLRAPISSTPPVATPDFMSPSSSVFHSHTLDLPLEVPPPVLRATPPAPTAPTPPPITLAPPPMRALYRQPSTAPSTHVPPPAARGLGRGWAEEARRGAASAFLMAEEVTSEEP